MLCPLSLSFCRFQVHVMREPNYFSFRHTLLHRFGSTFQGAMCECVNRGWVMMITPYQSLPPSKRIKASKRSALGLRAAQSVAKNYVCSALPLDSLFFFCHALPSWHTIWWSGFKRFSRPGHRCNTWRNLKDSRRRCCPTGEILAHFGIQREAELFYFLSGWPKAVSLSCLHTSYYLDVATLKPIVFVSTP